MAEITELQFSGDWKIIVQSKNAGWAQRVQLQNTISGVMILDGSPGQSILVRGSNATPWQLHIQHNDGQSGWQDNWLRAGPKNINGSQITQVVESEDITTPTSDRDFDDLVIRVEKVGMIKQPARPFAIWPNTMHIMPDGIFETTLGQYFMGIRIQNIWTESWPANAVVGITQRCKNWLVAEGITVVDQWSQTDQEALGQEVVNGRVKLGSIASWSTEHIYFKVDVSQARSRKHNLEVEVIEPGAPDPNHSNRKASAQFFVTTTTYDPAQKVFSSICDEGTLVASIKELVVEYSTFKRATANARKLFTDLESSGYESSGAGKSKRGCNEKDLEKLRQQLIVFLSGKPVDICDIWRQLQCCCGSGGFSGEDGKDDDWSDRTGTGLEFFSFPTVIDFQIIYNEAFEGQYGPIPFQDPWWKVLLMILAIILTIAAAASAALDLANRSSDVVIGTLLRSILNAFENDTDIPRPVDSTDTGSIDAAVALLNGNRSLTTSIFSYLDAANDEDNTIPIDILNGVIDTDGSIITNAEITQIFQNLDNDPTNVAFQDAVKVYKSGARTGLTRAIMTGLNPVSSRRENGNIVYFKNQVTFAEDPAFPGIISNSGDSGSLWLQRASNAVIALNHAGSRETNTATGCRIEDVMTTLGIKFN